MEEIYRQIEALAPEQQRELIEFFKKKEEADRRRVAVNIASELNMIISKAQEEGIHFYNCNDCNVYENIDFDIAAVRMINGKPIISFFPEDEISHDIVDW